MMKTQPKGPRKGPLDLNNWKSVRLPREDAKRLEEIAYEDDRTIDSLIRRAVREFLERNPKAQDEDES